MIKLMNDNVDQRFKLDRTILVNEDDEEFDEVLDERNVLEKVNTELKIKNLTQDGELRAKQDINDAKNEEIA